MILQQQTVDAKETVDATTMVTHGDYLAEATTTAAVLSGFLFFCLCAITTMAVDVVLDLALVLVETILAAGSSFCFCSVAVVATITDAANIQIRISQSNLIRSRKIRLLFSKLICLHLSINLFSFLIFTV